MQTKVKGSESIQFTEFWCEAMGAASVLGSRGSRFNLTYSVHSRGEGFVGPPHMLCHLCGCGVSPYVVWVEQASSPFKMWAVLITLHHVLSEYD